MNSMNFSRRSLLQGAGASAALLGMPLRALALEDQPLAATRKPTVILVFLRGGMDGLNLIVPHGEPEYYRLRPGISIPRPGGEGTALDLDGFFGLHPAAASLAPLFAQDLAVALPAVGHAGNSRSHFKEQDLYETALVDSGVLASGWLNRHLVTSTGRGPVRALALGDTLPRSLRGEASALALRSLDELSFDGAADSIGRTLKALGEAYSKDESEPIPAALNRGGRTSLEALEHLQGVARQPNDSKVEFPSTDLGRRAREASRLIRADLGLEVIELDLGGWDTHQNQGRVTGPYANRLRQVAEALSALVLDLEDRLDDVMILTVTEFGRTVAQNGTNGTDHGWASCALAMGGPVLKSRARRAGPILGSWPGLTGEQLNQGRDLPHTTDFRDIYGELLTFLGNEQANEIVPGHQFKPVNLL
jgi:uncharacterized protein (DUF1501 family)